MIELNAIVTQEEINHFIEWKVAAVLPSPADGQEQLGLAGPVVGIHKDLLIIGGGANFPHKMPWFGGEKKYRDDIFIFSKNKNEKIIWSGTTYKLPFPIAYGASCSTPNGIVYAGGENKQGLSNQVMLIQWNEVENRIDILTLPELPFLVTNLSIAAIGNVVYVAGGELADNVSDMFLSLNLDSISKGWQKMPKLPYKVSHSVMVSVSDDDIQSIYVIGGRKRNKGDISTLYSCVFKFDLKTNLWYEKASLPYCLSAGTGIAFNNKSILLFGGDKGETFLKVEALIASINVETDSIKKEKLNLEKSRIQSNHPGFSKEVIRYDIQKNIWSVMDFILNDVPVTTTAIVWKDNIIIPSGEIKAGVRTKNILAGKI